VLIGIDHLVIAIADPDAAAVELEAVVGLRATGGGRHEAMGTHNRLVWLGDTYLELIGVWDERLAAESWIGRPTLEALREGRSFATFAVATDTIAHELARLRDLGASWDGPVAGERLRLDGRLVRWKIAVPGRLWVDRPPFLIEHDTTAAEWTPPERDERADRVHPIGAPVRLEALELPVGDVRQVADRYLRTLGFYFRPSLTGGGARDTNIGTQLVRLRFGGYVNVAAPALPTIRLYAAGVEGRVVDVLGLRWVVRG